MENSVRIYTTSYCGFCRRAKEILKIRQIEFEEVDVTTDPEKRDWLVTATGRCTVPQIFIGEGSIGGYDELRALDDAGELARRVAG